jgi:hypothetical protein
MKNKIYIVLIVLFQSSQFYSQFNIYHELRFSYSLELAGINKNKDVRNLISKSIQHDTSYINTNSDGSYSITFLNSAGFDTIMSTFLDDKVMWFKAVSSRFDKIINIQYYTGKGGGGVKYYKTYDLIDSTSKIFYFNYEGKFRDLRFDSQLGECEEMRIDYSTSKKSCYITIFRSCLTHEIYSFDKKSGLISFSIVENSRGSYKTSKTRYILKNGKIIERRENSEFL